MSLRSQKRKLKDKKYQKLLEIFTRAYREWELREPPWWNLYARWKWIQDRPSKPKKAVEYMELEQKYGHDRCWI